MPGRIDTKRGIAHTGGILSGFMWEQPFAALLEQRLGVPVTIANDGKCAAAAEAWTGLWPEWITVWFWCWAQASAAASS